MRGDPTDTTSDLQKITVSFKGIVTPENGMIGWVGLDHFKDRRLYMEF